MARLRICLFLTIGLALTAGCERPAAKAPPKSASAPARTPAPVQPAAVAKRIVLPPAIPAPPGFPTVEEAFRLAPHEVDDSGWSEPLRGDGLIPTRGGFALLVRGAEDECHACSGTLNVVYFRRVDGRWAPYRQWADVYEGGGWGGNYEVETIRLGRPNPTLKLSYSYGNGGDFGTYISILELTPARPILRIDEVQTDEDNSGAAETPEQACFIDSEIRPLRRGQGLAIHYTGARAGHVKVDAVVHYSGTGDRWRPHPRAFDLSCRLDRIR